MSPIKENIGKGFSVRAIISEPGNTALLEKKEIDVKLGRIADFAVNKLIELARETGTTWYLRGIIIDSEKDKEGNTFQTGHLVMSQQGPEEERKLMEEYSRLKEAEGDCFTVNEGEDERTINGAGKEEKTLENKSLKKDGEEVEEAEEESLKRPDFVRYCLGGENYNFYYPIWVPTQEIRKYYGPNEKRECLVRLRIKNQVVFWGGQTGTKEYKMESNILRIASGSELCLIDGKGRGENQGMFWFSEGGYGSEDETEDPSMKITKELVADDLFSGIENIIEGQSITDSLIAAFNRAGAPL